MKHRIDLFCKKINAEFETFVLMFLPLDGKAAVNRHVDTQNCDELTEVLLIQKGVVEDSQGRYVVRLY